MRIIREYYNRIENGRTQLTEALKEELKKQIERFNTEEPLFLLIDYFRVRFPTTDALTVIQNVMHLKEKYLLHEEYGKYGYEESYHLGDIEVMVSHTEELDTSVSILLGETVQEHDLNESDLKSISAKLESMNLLFAKRSEVRSRMIRYLLILLCVFILAVLIAFAFMQGEYLNWDHSEPEFAIAGTILHGAEFLFVRFAPFVFIGALAGIVCTYKKR